MPYRTDVYFYGNASYASSALVAAASVDLREDSENSCGGIEMRSCDLPPVIEGGNGTSKRTRCCASYCVNPDKAIKWLVYLEFMSRNGMPKKILINDMMPPNLKQKMGGRFCGFASKI